ncbi:MAG: 16S rRNA (cytosine(967)-C(5))-methyltransferase RsmB [Deltaproteobacteria bacterium]|nr:16S rRNA (cytosine(967)-C(5))-methyltransferase RsmB [Candidatus Tharpella sp.]
MSAWEKRPQALDQLLEKHLRQTNVECSQIQRALATHLTAGVVRWHLRLDYLIGKLQNRKKKIKPELKNILRLALFELESPVDKARPDYAIVSESVNLARIIAPGREGFINGVLRSYLRRDIDDLLPEDNNKSENLAIRHSLPSWLIRSWQNDFNQVEVQSLCRQANQFTGTTFRINRLKLSRDNFLQDFETENDLNLKLKPGIYSESAFSSTQAAPLINSEWFKKGYFSVQDEGAQLIGELLNPQPGEVILDACAAPGGKTAHLAELINDQGQIIAADLKTKRLKRVNETIERLGLSSIRPVCLDLTVPLPEDLPQKYDAILVDAPCSGLGVIRRQADLRWRKKPGESRQLAIIQLQILQNCSRYLKVGGRLLYATCTTSRAENYDVIHRFLAANHDFRQLAREEIQPQRLQAVLNRENFLETGFIKPSTMDGFFAAILTRTG